MKYFTDIVEAATSIFEGLTITASHLFRKPITIQYPDRTDRPVKEMLPTNYRGFLNVDMKICTGCTLCMMSCPIQCINIGITKSEGVRPLPAGAETGGNMSGATMKGSDPVPKTPPQRLISKFDIDIGKCMFCGLCTEPCPTGAIHFTREFEGSTPDLKELVFEFVKGEPVVPYKKGAS